MDLFESGAVEGVLGDQLLAQSVHPDDTGTLLRYIPAALTHLSWRNSLLEDWHAGTDSRITDGEMMRANVATTRIFHQSLWFAIGESWAELGPLAPDLIGVDQLVDAFDDALETAFDPERRLPHGITLRELGGSECPEFVDQAELQLGALLDMAEQHGVPVVVRWLAVRGTLMVPNWWGTPRWPYVVDELFRRLDDPEHDHWRSTGPPAAPPAPADDRAWFRSTLLCAPDELTTEVLDYCIHEAAIGFIRPEPWSQRWGQAGDGPTTR